IKLQNALISILPSFFHWSVDHQDLHSFPTRRSSDLFPHGLRAERLAGRGVRCFHACNLRGYFHLLTHRTGLERDRDFGGLCDARSEEHTSELQSLAYLVCRLLLEKKKYAEITLLSHL